MCKIHLSLCLFGREDVKYFFDEEKALQYIAENKPKQLLFTSEDGVPIYDYNWVTVSHDFTMYVVTDIHQYSPSENYKRFSSREAANQYILANKPIQVSYKEITKDFSNFGIYTSESVSAYLLEFFKSKIQP